MSNRFRKVEGAAATKAVLTILGRWLRTATIVAGLLAVIGGLGYAGWRAVLRSPYFALRDIHIEPGAHLDREGILARLALGTDTNAFLFDAVAAKEALETHPWVAEAHVRRALPNRVNIRVQERVAAGVLVLEQLYLVDGAGLPFVQPKPAEVGALPLVTGLDRSTYEADPEAAHERIRLALAVARQYAHQPLAARRPLSNVHLAAGGRLELQLGRTRVALGHRVTSQTMQALERVFTQLGARTMDAAYILLSEDRDRAIVKEIPMKSAISASLSVKREGGAH
jgi:cell division protein FtsQ